MSQLVIWMCGHYRSGYVQHHLRRGCCPSCGEPEIREQYSSFHYDISGYPLFPVRRRDST